MGISHSTPQRVMSMWAILSGTFKQSKNGCMSPTILSLIRICHPILWLRWLNMLCSGSTHSHSLMELRKIAVLTLLSLGWLSTLTSTASINSGNMYKLMRNTITAWPPKQLVLLHCDQPAMHKAVLFLQFVIWPCDQLDLCHSTPYAQQCH